mgnify:CR=1 FL=1
MEPKDNVITICSECSERLYPNRGRWTKRDMRFCTHAKKVFGREHMWVKILKIREDGIVGTVANIPVFPDSPNYDTEVFVKYADIEDVI